MINPTNNFRAGATKNRRAAQARQPRIKDQVLSMINWGPFAFGGLVGVIVTSLFFLFFSTSDINIRIPTSTIRTTDTHQIPTKQQHAKSTPPKFEFYNELTKQEIKPTKNPVLDLKSTAQPPSRYVVQAGSFKRRVDAETLMAELTLNGFDARINLAKLPSGEVWHRVILGPYENEQVAYDNQRLLQNIKVEGTIVLKQ